MTSIVDTRVKGREVYANCPSDAELEFACGDSSGKLYSIKTPAMDLLSSSCTKFNGGANTPFGGDYILSIDSSNPSCKDYNIDFDIYMHFGTQWGCARNRDTQIRNGWWFSISYYQGS